jgi:Icc-related predicted phosphoesterase
VIRVAAAADFHAGQESAGTLAPLLTGLQDEADLYLIAGDLTRSGRPAEAEIVAAELANVGIPVVVVLGNHDYHGGQVPAITRILKDAGIHVLDRSGVVLDVNGQRVAIAGAKGFGGGFGAALAEDFGEPEMRQWIGYAEAEAEALENALSALVGDARIVLLHYAPIPDTLNGERLELYPFLGNSMLGEAIDHAGADLVVHGHSHQGSLAGATPGGVPVRNVARAVIRAPYTIFTIETERDDEARPRRGWQRIVRSRERGRGTRLPRWPRRVARADTRTASSDSRKRS